MIKKISASNISFRSKVKVADKTTSSYNSLDNILSSKEREILQSGIKSLERNGNYDTVTLYVDSDKQINDVGEEIKNNRTNNVGVCVTEIRDGKLSLGRAEIKRDDWGELSLQKIKQAYNDARKNLLQQKPSLFDLYRI